jgi:hypothetical protein
MTSQTATNPLDREKIPLLILGDGTFALETLDIAESTGRFSPLGFVNSMRPPPHAKTLAGLPIFFADALPPAHGLLASRRYDQHSPACVYRYDEQASFPLYVYHSSKRCDLKARSYWLWLYN